MKNSRQISSIIVWSHVLSYLQLVQSNARLTGPGNSPFDENPLRDLTLPNPDQNLIEISDSPSLESPLRKKRSLDVHSNWKTRELYLPGFLRTPKGLCPNQGLTLDLLIIVISPYNHYKARAASRNTWNNFLSQYDKVKLAYLIDKPPDRDEKLDTELEYFDDIIQTTNMNGRYDSTLMVEALLEYVTVYCPKVKFVARVHDHVFVNVPQLLKILDENRHETKALLGKPKRFQPEDEKSSDLRYIAECLTPFSVFPEHFNKAIYVFPQTVVRYLRCYSMSSVYLPSDEIFFSGIIADRAYIRRKEIPNLFIESDQLNFVNVEDYGAVLLGDDVIYEQNEIWRGFLTP